MATATLSPQPVPNPSTNSISSAPMPSSSSSSSSSGPSVLDEVRLAQIHLRERLAGALSAPPPNTPASLLPTVPLIDIGPSLDGTLASRRAVAAQIREACLTTGFFQVSNHGITPAATDGVLEQARRFFHDLGPEVKEEIHIRHSPMFRGYEPGDFSYVNPDDDSRSSDADKKPAAASVPAETKEGFNFGYEEGFDPTGGDGQYVELDGSSVPVGGETANLWPDESVLPGFRAGVATYYGQVLGLARHLFRLFALSLELDEDYFEALTTHPGGIGRLLYYPGHEEAQQQPTTTQQEEEAETEKSETKLGLGAHTDYECFTLLLCDANPGLEILFPPSPHTHNRPIWRPCPVRAGTLTVNVADFLMRWTNGIYKSTVHRVVSKPRTLPRKGSEAGSGASSDSGSSSGSRSTSRSTSRSGLTGERYSVPFFFSINYDADVLALPEHAVGKPLFRPMRAGDYILERLRATKTLGEAEADVADDVGK